MHGLDIVVALGADLCNGLDQPFLSCVQPLLEPPDDLGLLNQEVVTFPLGLGQLTPEGVDLVVLGLHSHLARVDLLVETKHFQFVSLP